MPLNLLDGLPEWGGFNRLEKEQYYRLFIDGQTDTVELLTLASQIAQENEWSLEETVVKLQSARSNNLEAVMGLGQENLAKLLGFLERQKTAKLMQGFDLVKLILASRLSLEWLGANQVALSEYGVEFAIESLQDIPRQKWITDERRLSVVEQITELLPAPLLRPVEDFAFNELHEGKVPDSTSEGRDDDPLAPPSEPLTKPNAPTDKSESSGTTAISKSKPQGFQTLATAGKQSA